MAEDNKLYEALDKGQKAIEAIDLIRERLKQNFTDAEKIVRIKNIIERLGEEDNE
jgi:hypothetical protein